MIRDVNSGCKALRVSVLKPRGLGMVFLLACGLVVVGVWLGGGRGGSWCERGGGRGLSADLVFQLNCCQNCFSLSLCRSLHVQIPSEIAPLVQVSQCIGISLGVRAKICQHYGHLCKRGN